MLRSNSAVISSGVLALGLSLTLALPLHAQDTEESDQTETEDQAAANDEATTEEDTDNNASEVEANADDGSDNLTDEQAVELVSAEQSASSADESDFIDMNVGLFRRWYDDAPFTLEGLLLTSEWSFPEIPVRLGPTMRYSKIESLDGYYNDGQLLDFSLRVTTFMDFEHILPYIAVDYTLGGLGTLRANQREGNIEESGTVDFKSTGFDIILGASFFWSNVGVFFETTAYANHKIDLAGNITRATIADSGAIDFTVLQPEDYSNKTFLSFALGMSVEL